MERSEGVGSIGSGAKGSIIQSPTGGNGGVIRSERGTMKNITEYLKNWSSNNFRRKLSVVPGSKEQNDAKT